MHLDICGHLNHISNGRKKIFYYLIGDFFRNTWVYILLDKSESFIAFKRFKALVENKKEKIILKKWNDGGGKYCSKEFEVYCADSAEHDIHKELIASYTPQRHDVS